ncbi:penicillin acylase family protein [Hyphomicrobium sp. CS1BSMeth3]|uniref:penicillin acylase family protein n=1 Tax=Hyphomicrobium sp. CS1BSMeth3 TaxID=1892844 RepID=UPI001AECBB09|nr:penicillin acylase family protein [Hyphomicrobium sp. CS1BSMeth3]
MRALLGVVVLALIGALAAWQGLRGSLARLEGEVALPGLSSPVTISRDALGVVTIEAGSEADAVRALGFVHAQERFFEMDLARRSAAGELSALLGPATVPMDRERRVHRLRARVAEHILDPKVLGSWRPLLDAYSAGANAGLAALSVRPWPYVLLRQRPAAWTAEDTVLTGNALYFDLQGYHSFARLALWRLSRSLPAPLFAMLNHGGTSWDAPIVGESLGDASLPGPDVIDLRRLPVEPRSGAVPGSESAPGSNNLAVAGALTKDGRAIVGGDMHLALRAPGIWFRARLIYPDPLAPGGRVDVSGFTVPGIPGVIAGSTGHVAWALTNAYNDISQWAQMPPCTGTPAQCGITEHREIIEVAGAAPEQLVVRETEWGPILRREPDGSLLALRWVAHVSGAVSSGLAEFVHARNLDDAFAIADRAGTPVQNLVVADSSGRIGWRILGALPNWQAPCNRTGIERVVVPAGACPPWSISTSTAPEVRDPATGRLWTANNRVISGAENARVGYIGRDNSARARQIRDGLMARERFTERDILGIELDDRAIYLERWWKLLRVVLAGAGSDPLLARLEVASQKWDGRASADSVSYLLTRRYREAVERRATAMLLGAFPQAVANGAGELRLGQTEGWLWPLVTIKPAHLLSAGHGSWDELLAAAARDVARDPANLRKDGTFHTWGDVNRASSICHPLARALPDVAKRYLCMPDVALPGDDDMPRVQRPAFGASQRMAVAPGHEAEGIIEMPAGQSGHPLSPFWRAGHEAWVQGAPTPFLPGPPQHVLRLTPRT